MSYVNENKCGGLTGVDRELDSEKQVSRMIKNLDNEEMLLPEAVLDNQAHTLNYKRHRILNESGIRCIILTRNKLGDSFAVALQKALSNDKYLKVVDIAGNYIK